MDATQPISITISKQFCGPPASGNGGYVAGVLADLLPETAAVTLRKPPPLETELHVYRSGDGLILKHGEQLIAEASLSNLEIDIPAPPSYEEALEHQDNYLSFRPEFFPNCFVCGPARAPQDGLRLFTGPLEGSKLVAAPWQTFPALFAENGRLLPAFYHAALDCPGAFALMRSARGPLLLGRMTAKVEEEIVLGEELIVTGWSIGSEGRKHYAGTAVFNRAGALKAFAKSIWISVAK